MRCNAWQEAHNRVYLILTYEAELKYLGLLDGCTLHGVLPNERWVDFLVLVFRA
jgi:hypothetical protein